MSALNDMMYIYFINGGGVWCHPHNLILEKFPSVVDGEYDYCLTVIGTFISRKKINKSEFNRVESYINHEEENAAKEAII